MQAKVYSHKQLIGTVDLQIGDESMGCVFGEFLPTEIYYSEIQESVWAFWNDKSDYKKWESLRFNIQLDNGYFLYPAGGYTFEDSPEFPEEPKRIDIAGLDRHVIEDYFLQNPPRPFVEEPWQEILIDQKIALENQLALELGLNDNSDLDPKYEKHILADVDFSALCRSVCNDDVLFVTRKIGFDKQFSVVHLTWKKSREIAGYPSVELFKDFDEFKYLRLYPDKADYED